MELGRWRQIERLYHAALTRRADERVAFLADACAGDEALRREVESLLAQPASAAAFLDGEAVAAAAELVSDPGASVLTGRRLGAYQVQERIGVGGMGEVYRAHDTKLRRDVALKILPRQFTNDPDRLARFEREAYVLASLNHPHIGAIYGLEDADGVRALVLELVDGETLADRIARGPISAMEALTIARQMVDALDAAHERGIVHRDLKPANIKITSDGVVKVLDFGLAKAVAGDAAPAILTQSPTVTTGGTREGVILGTAAYMSPEQARGQTFDKRTDIWAFGCVLYEMLSGRAAFASATISDTIAAILEREPEWRALPVHVSPPIRHLLQRCLEKDLKRRLRDIGDARLDIEQALVPQTATARQDLARSSPRTRRLAWIAIGLLAVGGAVAAAVATMRGGSDASLSGDATSRTIATRLTDYGGNQTSPALSPDGRSFVFVSDHGGPLDIWLRQVSGGELVRLTNDAAEEDDLVYAPDAEFVYFTRSDQSERAIWRIGTLGGQARKVVADGFAPAPSADGRSLAYFHLDPDDAPRLALSVISLDDNRRRMIARGFDVGTHRAAWSHDGRWLAYIRGGLFTAGNLFVIGTEGDRELQVTHFTKGTEGLSYGRPNSSLQWLPNTQHIVVSYVPVARQAAPNDLGIVNVQDGRITRMSIAADAGFAQASVSADGSRMLATAIERRNELWKVPLGKDPESNGRAAVRLIDRGSPSEPFVSRDGHLVLFNGNATGSRNLWLARLSDAATPRQVTALPGDVVSHSSLSPDGTRIAFVSIAAGHSDIWTQNVDGSDLRQLTNDEASDSWPVWSPDGQSIAFSSYREGRQETWRIPASGGRPERVIDGLFRGDWIIDREGRELMVTGNGQTGLRLFDVKAGVVIWERALQGLQPALPLFSRDGRFITMTVRESRDRVAIHFVEVGTGASRVVAKLPFNAIFRASLVENDTALIVNRSDRISHIVMFDRFWTSDPR
jgi:serine/threonine protein kinase